MGNSGKVKGGTSVRLLKSNQETEEKVCIKLVYDVNHNFIGTSIKLIFLMLKDDDKDQPNEESSSEYLPRLGYFTSYYF